MGLIDEAEPEDEDDPPSLTIQAATLLEQPHPSAFTSDALRGGFFPSAAGYVDSNEFVTGGHGGPMKTLTTSSNTTTFMSAADALTPSE